MISFLGFVFLCTWGGVFATVDAGVFPVVDAKPEVKVSFDSRAFIINGERTLFIAGSVHYPRASSEEWPVILQTAKDK